ncbi:hypothetical protein ROA7450_03041 [Roseovarius albus]|uniref:Nucleotidyltransferase family protein n=1 Tax=Roseovarius albus TaxID=1247867 RepID=A0A1X6ZQV8_9RHOB|nr:nucleotidyltransferase family protein [Roseovarius albus]SLN58994.1 hypothetical protein ROA7450_03041 [Roseovarius albus]
MNATYRKLSAAHRAVLQLLQTYVAGTPPEGTVATLSEATPEELARIGQTNHVHALIGQVMSQHEVLQTAVPRDLYLYFITMYRANEERLAETQNQLAMIGKALTQAEIPAVVMKGGGDALDPLHADPAIRFTGDLDVLVPESEAIRAQDLLIEIGAQSILDTELSESQQIGARGFKLPEHHLPKILHPEWQLPLELHTKVGRATMDRVLPALDILSRRVSIGSDGLSVMAPEDRACHLLAHASHHAGEVDLRAWVDWVVLRHRCDRDIVRKRLEAEGLGDVFTNFETVAGVLQGETGEAFEQAMSTAAMSPILHSFGGTRSRQAMYLPLLLKTRLKALARSPEYRRYVLQSIFKPAWWKQVWQNHRQIQKNLR